MGADRDRVEIRPVEVRDAAALARLYADDRDFLEPFDPVRPPGFFTEAGQRALLRDAVELQRLGAAHRFVILAGGEPVGTIALSNVVRGAMEGANLGYWVARRVNGRGIATRAVGLAVAFGFGRARLHRIEAGTLLHNVASQRVLTKNGFRLIGVAPRYLHIGGDWRDHVLFQRLADEPAVSAPGPQDIAPLVAALEHVRDAVSE